MNIVIVKHENCGQKYLFRVPDSERLKAGNLVRVKTKKGLALATCLCDSFQLESDSQEMNAILMAFGTSQPLAPVVGIYSYREFPVEELQENTDADSVEDGNMKLS